MILYQKHHIINYLTNDLETFYGVSKNELSTFLNENKEIIQEITRIYSYKY